MKNSNRIQVEKLEIKRTSGKQVNVLIFTGSGIELLKTVSKYTEVDDLQLLDLIINNLLVNKGADWNEVILAEYLNIYSDSKAIFTLVWDINSGIFISHGAVFLSRGHPAVALVAHIRTHDDFKHLGLGTLVTEKVTRAGFDNGADVIVLATDDKINRLDSGEIAAHSLYSKMGYGIITEKRLIDTIDWLMIINRKIFIDQQNKKKLNYGKFPREISDDIKNEQESFIHLIREKYSIPREDLNIQTVTDGDLADLFLLLNLSPANDFKIKLHSWGVHFGPEFERSFIVYVRPALMDLDRLEVCSMILRDQSGLIVAICAAKLAIPFNRNTFVIDFYCFPEFLQKNHQIVSNLIEVTINKIQQDNSRSRPGFLSFCGTDEQKIEIFKELGFHKNNNKHIFYSNFEKSSYTAQEYIKPLDSHN
jgi:hypothetical protein